MILNKFELYFKAAILTAQTFSIKRTIAVRLCSQPKKKFEAFWDIFKLNNVLFVKRKSVLCTTN